MYQGDIILINIHAPKRSIKIYEIINKTYKRILLQHNYSRGFQHLLTSMDRSTKKEINKKTILNEDYKVGLLDIHKALHILHLKYTWHTL